MSKASEQLQKLKDAYEPYDAWVGAELGKIEALERELEQAKDPVFIAFRENPITRKLFDSAYKSYRSSRSVLANDDGKLSSEERMKLHIGTLWAMWYMRALGGDPKKAQQKVEAEIQSFVDFAEL